MARRNAAPYSVRGMPGRLGCSAAMHSNNSFSSPTRSLHSMTIVRAEEEESEPLPLPETGSPDLPPNVEKLVDEISGLTLLEVSMLADALKEKLNIPDAQPMMMGGGMPAAAGGMPGAAAAAAEEPAEEKTEFDVKLAGFDAKDKIKIIKEVRAMTGLGLKEAKAKVEEAPTVIKAAVSKAEAEEIQGKLKDLGASVELE